jgi:hypothetical protein
MAWEFVAIFYKLRKSVIINKLFKETEYVVIITVALE